MIDKNIYVYDDEYYGKVALTDDVSIEMCLNDKVEIIEEEKEIEEIKMIGCNMEIDLFDKKTLLPTENMQTEFIISKINELVREVRKLKNKL